MKHYFNKLKQHLFPRIIARFDEQGICFLEYVNGCWKQFSRNGGKGSFFGQEVLLIPESLTLFRVRTFPQSSVKQSELAEAIDLDIDLWSPWEEPIDYYFWPMRSGDTWRVAIWIWQASALGRLIEQENIVPTHIMPERAWRMAAVDSTELPAIYIDQIDSGKWCYSLLSSSGMPLNLSQVTDKVTVHRFWCSLDGEARHYPVLVDAVVDQTSWPETGREGCREITQKFPRATALRYARQPGVKDWSEPFSWLKPVAAVMALYLVWILGNGLILLKQNQFVADQVVEARGAAAEVLDQRAEVERIHAKLARMQNIRSEQANFERVLAALSVKLPKDAWLDAIEYNQADDGWIDILGNAEQSVVLAVVLEEMPEIQHAMFLGDIRKDARTGLEPFRIRLKLTDRE